MSDLNLTLNQSRTHVFKDDAEVNMDQLAGQLIDEDVGAMAIAYTEHVTDYTGDGYTSDIVESHREPCHRFTMLFGKVVSHDGLEFAHNVNVAFCELGRGRIFRLNLFELRSHVVRRMIESSSISDPISSATSGYMGRSVLDMCWFEELSDGLTVTDKFHHSRSIGQRYDSISPESEIPSFGLAVPTEDTVRHFKDLLHHSVLAQLVVALKLC